MSFCQGVYISDLEKRDVENDFMVLVAGKPIPFHCVSKDKEENVFKIDLVKGWKEIDAQPGWSNEAAVELFIR